LHGLRPIGAVARFDAEIAVKGNPCRRLFATIGPLRAGSSFPARGEFMQNAPRHSKQQVIPTLINSRPQPPRPDRIRSIRGSFSWIDHRFLRQGFDQGLTRVEKLLYFVLIAVSNRDGVSFYSDERLAEILEIQHAHELSGARNELMDRGLIAFEHGLYQVLDLPDEPHRN
jgi:hypothetical protein